MPRREVSLDHEAAVRGAIEYAEKRAGADDQAFVEALTARFDQTVREASRAAGRFRVTAGAAPRSFHIYKDARYLANARALARRTLAGTRVIGGRPVAADAFLDCVAVGSDDEWGCTGTLIASDVVVTAGHCADFATRVFFGANVAQPGRAVKVKKAVLHPKYHRGAKNDLMVLVLAEKVTAVAPRPLAAKTLIDKATDGRAVGFGNVDPMGMFGYGIKREVDVPVASPSCRGTVDGHDDASAYGCDVGLEFVAGRPLLERDSCTGDSGGPFYIQDKAKQWVLAGATSRATSSSMNNCGDGGIYVRLDRYRAWIDGIAGVTLP
ncbi:MAG TPA: trypsin-like serine protease [Vicinamibacteria bacterium]|nr:trypsin-like serine protease [Vicinamibacteria bacterium]